MVQCLMDLSVLEMCLIIAMKHHIEIYDNQAMNFEMVFTRYLKFVNANSNVQTVQRPVVMKAFEHLKVCFYKYLFYLCSIQISYWCGTYTGCSNLSFPSILGS